MVRILRCLARSGAPDDAAVAEAAGVLIAGGLVILPTDTVYGLAADPRAPGAQERLASAKGRAAGKPIPLLAASARQVELCGAEMDWAERALAARFWPGPLTLVLRVGAVEEGFRVPAHSVALAVIEAAGSALRTTSANRSGGPEPVTAQAAAEALADSAALCLDAGPILGGVPSTVARARAGRLEIIRAGAAPESELREVLARAGSGSRGSAE